MNLGTAAGSSFTAISRVSATAWMEATGVFISWEASATKSRRIASMRLASVTSWIATSRRPSPSRRQAALSSRRRG